MKLLSLFMCVLLALPHSAFAGSNTKEKSVSYEGQSQWSDFRQFVLERQEEDEKLGLSYMISGAIATVGGAYGYYAADEVFSRTMFAITSTIGIAAIGVGASYYWTGNEYDSFFYALDKSTISMVEKNKILQRYLEKERQKQEQRKWIRVATHALIAAVNIYSAARESDHDAKTVFAFLGGANAILAISYSF